jgi:hypothetical protein
VIWKHDELVNVARVTLQRTQTLARIGVPDLDAVVARTCEPTLNLSDTILAKQAAVDCCPITRNKGRARLRPGDTKYVTAVTF